MRARLLGGMVAAAISLVMLVSVAAQPARATDGTSTEVGGFTVTLLVSLGDKLTDGRLTPAEIAVVVAEVLTGVRDSGARILAEIDADRVSDSVTALRNAMGYASLMREGRRDANYFFSLAMNSAHVPHGKLESGSPTTATVDALGRTAMAGYDLYLSGRANLDQVHGRPISNDGLLYIVNEYLGMLDSLTNRLRPDRCGYSALTPGPTPFQTYEYRCTAFDGTYEAWQERFTTNLKWEVKRGEGVPWEEGQLNDGDRNVIANLAMRNTILFDAFKAQINLLALKERLTP